MAPVLGEISGGLGNVCFKSCEYERSAEDQAPAPAKLQHDSVRGVVEEAAAVQEVSLAVSPLLLVHVFRMLRSNAIVFSSSNVDVVQRNPRWRVLALGGGGMMPHERERSVNTLRHERERSVCAHVRHGCWLRAPPRRRGPWALHAS